MTDIVVDTHLGWRDVAAVAEGACLQLSEAAKRRIIDARAVVEAIVDRGIRAYGVNTGVGALCDVVVDRPRQRQLSHNILMSHATGIGGAAWGRRDAGDHGDGGQQLRARLFRRQAGGG